MCVFGERLVVGNLVFVSICEIGEIKCYMVFDKQVISSFLCLRFEFNLEGFFCSHNIIFP